jgi:hypothetical protein
VSLIRGGFAGFFVGLAAVLFASAAPAAEPPQLFSGIVSDSECGLDHTRMKKQHHLPNDLACTRDCCEKFKQEYVLADHTTGEVYQIDDQKAVRRYANRLVRILGTLESESGKIRLVRVEAVR